MIRIVNYNHLFLNESLENIYLKICKEVLQECKPKTKNDILKFLNSILNLIKLNNDKYNRLKNRLLALSFSFVDYICFQFSDLENLIFKDPKKNTIFKILQYSSYYSKDGCSELDRTLKSDIKDILTRVILKREYYVKDFLVLKSFNNEKNEIISEICKFVDFDINEKLREITSYCERILNDIKIVREFQEFINSNIYDGEKKFFIKVLEETNELVNSKYLRDIDSSKNKHFTEFLELAKLYSQINESNFFKVCLKKELNRRIRSKYVIDTGVLHEVFIRSKRQIFQVSQKLCGDKSTLTNKFFEENFSIEEEKIDDEIKFVNNILKSNGKEIDSETRDFLKVSIKNNKTFKKEKEYFESLIKCLQIFHVKVEYTEVIQTYSIFLSSEEFKIEVLNSLFHKIQHFIESTTKSENYTAIKNVITELGKSEKLIIYLLEKDGYRV